MHLTALSRDIITDDFEKIEFSRIIGIGFLFVVTILGIYLLNRGFEGKIKS